jgi:glycosyltransferase involved in cell wall biosynthesis
MKQSRDLRAKVVWLCTPVGAPQGGTYRRLGNWIRLMDRGRIDPTLLLGGPDRRQVLATQKYFEQFGPLTVLHLTGLHPIGQWFVGGLRQLRQCLRVLAPDILHTIFVQSDIAGGWVRRQAGVPVHISSLEGALVPSYVPPLKRLFYLLAYRLIRGQLDAVVALSQMTRAEAVRDYGVPWSRTHVIPSGVDLSEFQFKSGWPYAESQQTRVIGMVARLNPEKAPALLLAAAPLVLQRHSDVRFVIAGTGPEEPRLQKLAQTLGVSERVEFMGWVECVANVLQTFDVFVFTSQMSSRFEGLPWAILEAQAVGVPTIASSVAGVPEIIEHERTGLLLQHNTPAELADHITWMLNQRERAAALGSSARRMIETAFTVEKETSDILSLYDQVLLQKAAQTITR